MANRRCLHTLTRHYISILSSSNPSHLQSLKSLSPALLQTLIQPNPLSPRTLLSPKSQLIFTHLRPISYSQFTPTCRFSSQRSDNEEEDDDKEGFDDDDDDVDDDDDDDDDGDESVSASNCGVKREYTLEEKEEEAAAIGYKVIGPLERSDRVFKPYEPVFAVVQIGSHQFKVSNGDCIYTERLKFCEVNNKYCDELYSWLERSDGVKEKKESLVFASLMLDIKNLGRAQKRSSDGLILNKVLMLGSQSQTIIGRPILPDAAVHAVVEEHALDAKVIIFKKKRRKNYRRTKGHRQELTKLRITDIQGLEKPEMTVAGKTEKVSVKKLEKVAVAA